ALESAAFVEKDIDKLIDIALSYIPAKCDCAKAVRLACDLYAKGTPLLEARDEIIRQFKGGFYFSVSKEDIAKGLDGGKLGWEVPSNLALVICGLKYGENDFGKSLCMAVNCGEDTDCTAATVGAILGIINGYDYIPKKWIDPIGTGIKTACLNLGDLGIYNGPIPQDVFSLTERVMNIAKQVTSRKDAPLKISSEKTDLSDLSTECLYAGENDKYILSHFNGPVYKFDFFNIYIDYKGDPYIQESKSKNICVTVENTYHIPERINLRWHLPQGFTISPSHRASAYLINHDAGRNVTFDFEIIAGDYVENINHLIIEVTVEGRSTCMLVPVVLIYNTEG
ncbi:MAG TPA: ADP-ribosylglycohydrolase family protein, partial [Clostridia bacterium]